MISLKAILKKNNESQKVVLNSFHHIYHPLKLKTLENELDKLKEKLIKFEAELLEQEHRPFHLIWNFLNRKNKWKNKNDIRHKAVTKAIFWRFIFSPSTIAVVSTGFVGILTLFFLYRQTQLFENQNILFETQNTRIEQQTHLIEADRRSAQIFIMGEVLGDINKELEDQKNTNRTLSNTLVGRIISLSRAMKAYRYLQGDSLIRYPLSPERGQLLISLLESEIDSLFFLDRILNGSDFRQSELSGADLWKANLYNAYMQGANLESADVKFANLSYAQLQNARMEFTELSGSNLSYTKLNGANLQNATLGGSFLYHTQFQNSNLCNADLTRCDLEGVSFEGANLKGASLFETTFKDVNLTGIISLDSVKIHRNDWITYVKDSLELKGANQIAENYIVDSVKVNSNSEYAVLMLLRKNH